jgi:hypothetical protein
LLAELPETGAKNIRVRQSQGIAGPVNPLGKAHVVGVLNRHEGSLQVGKYIIKGHKLSQVSLIPVGPHSSVSAPIAEDGLRVLGTGVVHQVNH